MFAFSQGYIWHNVLPVGSTSWNGWASIPQSTLLMNNAPAVAIDVNQHPEIFARGNDNAVWYNAQDSVGNWLGWGHIPSTNTPNVTGLPVVGQSTNVETFVFSQGYIWHNVQQRNSSTWSGWSSLPEGVALGDNTPAAGNSVDGSLDIFAVKSDGSIWFNRQISPGSTSWNGWVSF